MKKKLIIGALALSMCLSFASCDKINGILGGDSSSSSSTVETEYDVVGAADALYGSLVDQNEETRVDYEVPNTITYVKNVYTITWSVDVTEGVALVKGESATTVDVDENAQADVAYVLTAVVTDPNGETETVTFERKVLKAPPCVPEDITAKPVEGKAYKLYVYQSTKNADCYFNGNMSDFYYATSEDYAEGVDVYAEYKEGSETEFYLSFESSVDGKQYITIEEGWNSKSSHWTFNPKITSEAKTAFVYSEEYKTIVTTILARSYDDYSNEAAEPSVDTTVYLGNYSTHMTFSVSKVSKLSEAGNNVGNLVEMINKNEISAEDKVAFEKDALSLAEKYVGDATVELSVLGNRYKDVTIAWAEESDNLAISADGKTLNITAPAAETTATVTATLTCGNVTDTKEFTLTLKPQDTTNYGTAESPLTVTELVNATKDYEVDDVSKQVFFVKGEVKSIGETGDYYSNVYIKDGENEFYIYTISLGDGINGFKVGDVIVAKGYVKNYGGTIEMASNNGTYVYAISVTPGEGGETGGEGGNETPDAGTPATQNTADLNKLTPNTKYESTTSPDGWKTTNAAILTYGTANNNGYFKMFETKGVNGVCLNGKTTALGSLVSPTFTGGIKKLSFNYGFTFGDNQFSITINVKDANGNVVATQTIEKTELTKLTKYDYVWTLKSAVEGNFSIEIKNNGLSNSSKNKDRLSLWNLAWDSVSKDGASIVPDGGNETPKPTPALNVITAPAVDTAYKFGMVQ